MAKSEQKQNAEPLKLYDKLVAIVNDVESVAKKGENTFDDYHYVRAVDLMALVRKKFVEYRLFMATSVVSMTSWENTGGKRKNGVNVILSHVIYDLDNHVDALSFQSAGQGVDSGDKAIYKALTGAIKYALRNLFLIPDETADPEADPQGSAEDDGPKEVKEEPKPRKVKKGDDETVGEPDRKRMFAILRGKKPDAEEEEIKNDMKAALKKFGWEGTADVTTAKYEQFCEYLQGDKK